MPSATPVDIGKSCPIVRAVQCGHDLEKLHIRRRKKISGTSVAVSPAMIFRVPYSPAMAKTILVTLREAIIAMDCTKRWTRTDMRSAGAVLPGRRREGRFADDLWLGILRAGIPYSPLDRLPLSC
jgi:hypothetical protein